MMEISDRKSSIIQYEYFIVEEEKSITILPFVWYIPEKCNVSQLVEVNTYDKSLGRWQHENFVIDKYSNFYGRQISFLFERGWLEFNPDEIDYEKQNRTTPTMNVRFNSRSTFV